MNITAKYSYQRSGDGNFKSVSINLGWYDLVRITDEGRVEGYHIDTEGDEFVIRDDHKQEIPLRDALRVLQAEADILLWKYVYEDGGCQREIALEEMRKAKERARILN